MRDDNATMTTKGEREKRECDREARHNYCRTSYVRLRKAGEHKWDGRGFGEEDGGADETRE